MQDEYEILYRALNELCSLTEERKSKSEAHIVVYVVAKIILISVRLHERRASEIDAMTESRKLFRDISRRRNQDPGVWDSAMAQLDGSPLLLVEKLYLELETGSTSLLQSLASRLFEMYGEIGSWPIESREKHIFERALRLLDMIIFKY